MSLAYSFAIPARAQSSSSWLVPPPTPQAPSTTPSRMIGTPPWLGMPCPPSAARMPEIMGVLARSWSSPLVRPESGARHGLTLRAVNPAPNCAVHAIEGNQPSASVAHGYVNLDAHFVRGGYRPFHHAVCLSQCQAITDLPALHLQAFESAIFYPTRSNRANSHRLFWPFDYSLSRMERVRACPELVEGARASSNCVTPILFILNPVNPDSDKSETQPTLQSY